MSIRRTLAAIATTSLLLAAGCASLDHYLAPEEPRYSAAYAAPVAGEPKSDPRAGRTVKVVTFNIELGRNIDQAISELSGSPDLRGADIILLQEMSGAGVDAIAAALGYNYVYYPISLRKVVGEDFGNAVLTKWPIVGDSKILLPHENWTNARRRIAVKADIDVAGRAVQVYSVHTETTWLRLNGRVDQARAIVDSIDGSAGIVIVGGDFNTLDGDSLPRTDAVFADAGFERASNAAGSTLRFGVIEFELDHIYSRGARVLDAGRVSNSKASDHLPVWVELAIE